MTRIGIFGGGQLAQMLTQAAVSLGLETVIAERTADSPAGRLTQHELVGAWEDPQLLSTFAAHADRITLENEFVDAAILAALEAQGKLVVPSAAAVARVQDKLVQKQCLAAAGLAVAPFRAVATPADVHTAATDFGGWPVVLKARRNGYDGYGNATLRSAADVDAAWERLQRGADSLLVEAFVPFVHELAVMIVRSLDGQISAYPVVETVQEQHICRIVRAPAQLPAPQIAAAGELAAAAVTAVGGTGIFGVELFALANGQVLINELAPRPHNSGHYSIEGCITSQFENHLRAVMGWPIGATTLRAPAVVMVNLLGRQDGPVPADALAAALAIPHAHLHLYGKRQSRRGRKMGHVTVLGSSMAEAEALALQAAALVQI